MIRGAAMAVVLMGFGCSEPPCGPMEGVYEVTWTRLNGDCGVIDEPDVIEVGPMAEPPEIVLGPISECSGAAHEPDACTFVAEDLFCPVRGADAELLGYVSMDGTIEQVEGPALVAGDLRLCAYDVDETPICCGLYAYQARRFDDDEEFVSR